MRLVFAHLSDTHLRPRSALYNGLDTHDRLATAVAAVQALETPPAFVLVSGDLTDLIEPEASYHALRDHMQLLRVPVVYALGNHDERAAFRSVFADDLRDFLAVPGPGDAPCHGVATHGDVRVIVLDTVVPGLTRGEVDAAQLAWLAQQLDAPWGGPTLLMLHHCPLPVLPHRFQPHQLTNADALAGVIAPRAHVLSGMLGGHIHFASSGMFAGVPMHTAPGIAMGIAPDAQLGLRLTDALGFNLCALHGRMLVTHPIIVQQETQTLRYDKAMAWN
jgi:3',5'-cyclic-AMP phosphodiesterase